jgi:hypothetical protein
MSIRFDQTGLLINFLPSVGQRMCGRVNSQTALLSLAVWLASSLFVQAQPNGKTVAEWWEAAYLQGTRSGHVHTFVKEFEQDGVKLHRATIEMRVNVKRFNDTIQLAMDSGTHELPDGTVLGTFMRQMVGKSKKLEIIGAVDGRQLTLTLDQTKPLTPAPWDAHVLGVAKQRTVFKDRQVKPGDSFAYKSFEPTINLVATTRVTVKDLEEVELFGGKQKRRLLRVEAKADKIDNFQLPPYIAWLDDDLMPVRVQLEIPGLGKVMLYQTTRSFAVSAADAAPAVDVGTGHYVRLNRQIVRPHDSTNAVYRIVVDGEDDVASVFAKDVRQQSKNVRGNTLELHVRSAGSDEASAKPGPEFTQNSYFIACDDQKVQELAREAVGTEKESWQKSLKIEKWVHDHMRPTAGQGLAPADEVARNLNGDCTEYAMLTAAMCRAVGIPSKTSLGLIYANVRSGPVFAFHMWTEVWIEGRWRPLDATLGLGHIGAAHLKICDQSWHDERSLTPLLPVLRVLGKLTIEVVRVDGK